MGAQITLAGLFSPHSNQNWSDSFDWEPVPIYRVPKDQDFLLVAEKPCDRFDYEMIKYINSIEYQSLFERNRSLISYLEENTGIKLETLTTINHLYDKLFIEQLRGYRYVL